MKKRKDIVAKERKKFYVLMAVMAILMISVTGATYAFFSLTATNNTTISGTVGGSGIELTVTKKLPITNPTNMIPQLESTLPEAVGSTYNCIDDLGNVVCQVYQARVQNVGSVAVATMGTIQFSGIDNMPNLKWKRINSLTDFGDYTTQNAATFVQPIEEISDAAECEMLDAGAYIDYYFVIWVDEIDQLQTDKGTFTASIQFDASTSCDGWDETYAFNDSVMYSNEFADTEHSINFSVGSTNYTGIRMVTSSTTGFNLDYNNGDVWETVYSESGGWVNATYKTITVDLNSQSTSFEFKNWFYGNTTKKTTSGSEERAFAVYSEDDYSLFFYKNSDIVNVGNVYNGKTVTDVYTGFEDVYYYEFELAPWYDRKNDVYWVEVVDEIEPISTAYWFYEFLYCDTFKLQKLDVSNVTDMTSMFERTGSDDSVYSVEISGLSNWDVSNVTSMSSMFAFSGENTTVWNIGNLDNWDVSNVYSMSYMFGFSGYSATTWNVGNLSNWDVSNVSNMSYMFMGSGYSDATWSVGDLSNWDVSNVDNMAHMFFESGYNSTTWNIGNLDDWDVSNVGDMEHMFDSSGYNATTWNVGNLDNWEVSNVVNMAYMFSSSGYSATTWNIGNLDNWDVSNVGDMKSMFDNSGYSATTWNIGNLDNWVVSSVENMAYMFLDSGYNATTWDVGNLNNWDVSSVVDMDLMFSCSGYSATTWNVGNIGGWDVSNVLNFRGMFSDAGYSANYSLDLRRWDINPDASYDEYSFGDSFGDEDKIIPPAVI